MSRRYEEIDDAYHETFGWVFGEQERDTKWDNFTAYLLSPDCATPYFINGKAGSGKSTLMKYLLDSPETEYALRQWAGCQELLIVGFLFWNLGSTLQKSHKGMLRALLYTILDRYPGLIPIALTNEYQQWGSRGFYFGEPTYVKLKKAFERLKMEAASLLKICFFVDGIDELEGDVRDILKFLHSLASFDIKVVVSARPVNPCLNVLQDCPSLRLQVLTSHDMDLFIYGELSSHPLMVRLERSYPLETQGLVAQLREKAQGVFLWVKLVIRILVDCLEAGDNLEDLTKRVDCLPSDLEKLYRRMIERMQPEHQVDASCMFQICLEWIERANNELLDAILLSNS
jgi:hypothetical protein